MYIHRRIKTKLRFYTALALPIVVMIGCAEGTPTSIDYSPAGITPTRTTPTLDPGMVLALDQKGVLPDNVIIEKSNGKIDVGQLIKTVVNETPVTKNNPQEALAAANPVLYFATDKDEVAVENIEALKPHADYLVQHPQTVVLVNGHADERGTKQHNEDLSLRRAMQVAKLLESLGVQAAQIKVNSLGEDAPVGDPSKWDENRRVELLYSDNYLISTR